MVKKRVKQHLIDAEAKRLFETSFPKNFVVRPQDGANDYGVDYEMEIFAESEDGQQLSTGILFKAQVKGAAAAKRLSKEPFVVKPFEIEDLHYWYEQLEIPLILVVVDLETKQVYWTDYYSNKLLRKDYSEKKGAQSELTVYFPVEQTLPASTSDLVSAINNARERLSLRRAANVTFHSLSAHFHEVDSIENELQNLKNRLESGKLIKLHKDLDGGKLEAVWQGIEEILQNKDSSEILKINAILSGRHVLMAEQFQADIQSQEETIMRWQVTMFNDHVLTDPSHSPFAAAFKTVLGAILQLAKASHESYDLGMSMAIQTGLVADTQNSSITTLFANANLNMLLVRNVGVSNSISAALGEIAEATERLTPPEYSSVLAALGFHLVSSLRFHLLRLQLENRSVGDFRDFLAGILKVVFLSQLQTSPDFRSLMAILTKPVELSLTDDSSWSQEFITTLLAEVPDPILRNELRVEADAFIREVSAKRRALSSDDRAESALADEKEMARTHLYHLGFDVSLEIEDLSDRITEEQAQIHAIVKLAYDEHDPTEVLSHCEHLRIHLPSFLPPSPIAESLGLWGGRFKSLCCRKKEVFGSSATWILADAYLDFRKEFCVNCELATPRTEDWRATREWLSREAQWVKSTLSKLRQQAGEEE